MLGLKQIRAIECVAKLHSFRLAADALNATQPTLSRLIAKSETDMDVSLFRRGWSGTETTAEGDIAVQHCSAIMLAIKECEQKIFAGRSNPPSLTRNMSLHQLETIDAILRTGGASAAAENLGRSQPAISRSLSSFVFLFELELFNRTHTGLEPLPVVHELANLYGTIRHHLEQTPLQLNKNKNEIVGRTAIGMLPFSGQELISKTFAELANLHPKVRLVCIPGSYDSLIEALRRRKIERIIGIMRTDKTPTGLTERALYKEQFTIVARADHELHGKVKTIADLKNTNWIVAPLGTPVRIYFENLFNEIGEIPPIQTCEMLSFTAAEQMLIESNSIAMLSYSQSKLAKLSPHLKCIDIDLPNNDVSIGITHLSGADQDPAIQMFDKILDKVVAQNAV